jgi:large subunit ribosomal protein L7/L12
MLRRVAALSWSASLHVASDLSSCAQHAPVVTQAPSHFNRWFSGETAPHPEINPAPSEKVLEIADAIETLTVKEVVWLNRILKERLGLSDADLGVGVMMAPQGAAAAPADSGAAAAEAVKEEEKKDFNVVIEGFDSTAKIKIIKELRAANPDLGLKEAKALVRLAC